MLGAFEGAREAQQLIKTMIFKRRKGLIKARIEGELSRSKAIAIASIFENEGAKASFEPLSDSKRITLKAKGLLRPMGMRLIIDELAK